MKRISAAQPSPNLEAVESRGDALAAAIDSQFQTSARGELRHFQPFKMISSTAHLQVTVVNQCLMSNSFNNSGGD